MKKKNKKALITVLCVIVAILIAAIISYACIQRYHTPEKALERMFSLRADMKLEEYYNCFDIPEESKCYMNSLEAYLLMAEENGWEKIDSFEITKKRTDTYSVKHGEYEDIIQLIKQSEKSSLGFDTYKIKIESITSPVFNMTTLFGTNVTVDGHSINSSKILESEIENAYYLATIEESENLVGIKANRNLPIGYFEAYNEIYDNYCFTNVFDREFEIVITSDHTDPFKIKARPSESQYCFRELKLSDETESELKELGESFMVKYYYALQNGDDFETISSFISCDENVRAFFEADYEELLQLFTRGETTSGVIDICFLDSMSTVNYPLEKAYNQNQYTVIATLDYSYNSISYDGYNDVYDYHTDIFDSKTFSISYIFENGKWVVSSIDDTLVNVIF